MVSQMVPYTVHDQEKEGKRRERSGNSEIGKTDTLVEDARCFSTEMSSHLKRRDKGGKESRTYTSPYILTATLGAGWGVGKRERERERVPRTGLAVRVIPGRLAVVVRVTAVRQPRYVAEPVCLAINGEVWILTGGQADQARGGGGEENVLPGHLF